MSNLATLRPRPFTKENPGWRHTQKHPNGYLTCKLKRLLKKSFRMQDGENVIKKISGAEGLMMKYIWEGLQGNVQAIEGILDRIDGKVNGGITLDQSTHYHYTKMTDEQLDDEIRKSYKDLFSKTSGRKTEENRIE